MEAKLDERQKLWLDELQTISFGYELTNIRAPFLQINGLELIVVVPYSNCLKYKSISISQPYVSQIFSCAQIIQCPEKNTVSIIVNISEEIWITPTLQIYKDQYSSWKIHARKPSAIQYADIEFFENIINIAVVRHNLKASSEFQTKQFKLDRNFK